MIKEFQNQYRWLSNFEPVLITLDGITYSSVEHAYMSAKSDNLQWKKFCADSNNNPGNVKREGRKVKLVDNWEAIKLDVMRECVNQKFNQEPFTSKLLATGTQHIQEGNTWNDKFWGVCLKTGEGQNFLGQLIMKVRNSLLYDYVVLNNEDDVNVEDHQILKDIAQSFMTNTFYPNNTLFEKHFGKDSCISYINEQIGIISIGIQDGEFNLDVEVEIIDK